VGSALGWALRKAHKPPSATPLDAIVIARPIATSNDSIRNCTLNIPHHAKHFRLMAVQIKQVINS